MPERLFISNFYFPLILSLQRIFFINFSLFRLYYESTAFTDELDRIFFDFDYSGENTIIDAQRMYVLLQDVDVAT